MNLLIVDDEIFAVQGILDGVDWSRLDYQKVLTANSLAQAIDIFRSTPVDVLLCDIEMPNGSGLDLIEWVRLHSPDTINIILSCHDSFEFARQAVKLNCLDYCLKPATPQQLADVLSRAASQVRRQQQQTLFEDVGRRLAHVLTADEEEEAAGKKNLAEQVAQHILEHIDETLAVEELAALFYVSSDHLTRLFKKVFGKTVIDYITDQRMFLAGELIRNSQLSITMVSAKVGFSNYSYFTKIFRKHFGVSPREYAARQHGK